MAPADTSRITRRRFIRDASMATVGGSLLLGARQPLFARAPETGIDDETATTIDGATAMSDVVLVRDLAVLDELERWNCCGAVFSLADDDLIHLVAPVRDLIRVTALAMQGMERDLALLPDEIPCDDRCGWVGSRANIWLKVLASCPTSSWGPWRTSRASTAS